MRYLEPSFSVPPAQLKADKNRHGQTWEDIFAPKRWQGFGERLQADRPGAESIPDATGDSLPHAEPDNTGHTCNGTYKTFSAAHCPYCWAEHAR